MKRLSNLYENCYDIVNILSIADKVCSKVRNKEKVDRFETYKAEHIINIKNRLKSLDKNLGKYNIFMITDPKCRIVMAQEIEDKILNHLIAEYVLVKTFEPRYANSIAATRINKGTKYGIYLVKKYLNSLKNKYEDLYILKIDIRKYFYRIDHEILKKILSRKIKDKRALTILFQIIGSTDEEYINKQIKTLKASRIAFINNASFISKKDKEQLKSEVLEIPIYEKGKGCPIGDQTSQAFGLIYLYEFNNFLKTELHLKYVVNYMDDFIIFHHDKEYLKKALSIIKDKLHNDYKLDVNEKKTRIDNMKNGVEFLGYRFLIKNNRIITKLRSSTKKKFKKRVKEIKYLYINNEITKKEFNSLIINNMGHFKWGDCHNLVRKNSMIKGHFY